MIPTTSTGSVKKKMTHPTTQKKCSEVFVKDKGLYRWNSAFKVYNNTENYAQLLEKDIAQIDWEKSN